MLVWELSLPKPPEDIWPIVVDFSERLDTANGEGLSAVSVECYKLYGYDSVVEQYDLTNAYRINVEIERYGKEEVERYSYLTNDAPSAELRMPVEYEPIPSFGMIPPESIVIGPEGENTRVSFNLRGGEDGGRYVIYIVAQTTEGRIHSCAIKFWVRKILF